MIRSFCIVCREMPIRMAYTLAHIKERGVDVEPFLGVYAPTFGVIPTIPYRQVDGVPRVTTIGHLGCTLSHYLLMRALEYMPQDETLIFEDDAILEPSFVNDFEIMYKNLPANWEFVQLAHFGAKDLMPIVGYFCRPLTIYPGGCHCYMVNRRGASRIVELMKTFRRPWDAQLAEDCWPYMNHWCYKKSLAQQRSVLGEWARSTLIDTTVSYRL